MPIKIQPYDFKEKLGIKRILEQRRFCYNKDEKQVEEIAICYGITDSMFKVTVTDLTEHRQCSKCHHGEEIYDYRILDLTFDKIDSAESQFKKLLKMAKSLKKAGVSKK